MNRAIHAVEERSIPPYSHWSTITEWSQPGGGSEVSQQGRVKPELSRRHSSEPERYKKVVNKWNQEVEKFNSADYKHNVEDDVFYKEVSCDLDDPIANEDSYVPERESKAKVCLMQKFDKADDQKHE